MVRGTLSQYIRRADSGTLDNLFHAVIAEMNRRKATTQKVDVGFWNSDGKYIEDIQEVDLLEMSPDVLPGKVWDVSFVAGEIITLQKEIEFFSKVNDIAKEYGYSLMIGIPQNKEQKEEVNQ